MPISDCPITWNQRLNAWDNETIEALQDRLIRERVIPSELATLFAQTMQWAKTHPLTAENTSPLLNCWSMLVLGSNIPWKEYDAQAHGSEFLPTLVASNPQGVLDHLEARVYARLKDREQSAAWIAHALHVATHFEAEKVAPVLSALAKTWNGDMRRSQDFAKAMGDWAVHFPWNGMHDIHAKFQGYPDIQKAILQWDGVCTAERVFQASSHKEGFGSPGHTFKNTGVDSAFHAYTLALNTSGAHLARRWGIPETVAGTKTDQAFTPKVRNAMEATWKMLRDLAEHHTDACDRSLLQQAGSWCMDSIPSSNRVIRYEKAEAILLGNKPYFTQALNSYLDLHTAKGESVGILFLEVLTHADPSVKEAYRPFLSSSAKQYLLDFMERAGNALASAESVPLLMSYLSSSDIAERAHSRDGNDQRLFWRAISEPESLNEHTRRELVQIPEIKKAILLATLLETHGVEHWGFHADHKNTWAQTLPAWYPDAMPTWEHVLRETLRWPKTAYDTLLNAVLEVQDVPRQRWDVIKHLVDSPAHNKNPRQAMAPTRTWNLGLPQTAVDMAWVMDALHAPDDAGLSLALPALDEARPSA